MQLIKGKRAQMATEPKEPVKTQETRPAEAMSNAPQVIGSEQVQKFTKVLQKYKAGKSNTERRIIDSESWWKLRNTREEQKTTNIGKNGGFTSVSGWLHNVIVAKHADAMEAFPEPNILPREAGDKPEATILTAVVPCVLEQNDFERTYSDEMWQKMKTGTGVYKRSDGNVNVEQFLDLSNTLVDVNGNLGEDSLRQIPYTPLDGNYLNMLDRTIQELRETSGNTETSTGSTTSGVTAASAIAALQEASGKGSRDSTQASYRAYRDLVYFCIELIRQFYEMPRQFRITGNYGAEQYITYSNAGIQPQHQGNDFGVDMGYRLPVFDIKVTAQKRNVYTKVTQNELALQFFQMGLQSGRKRIRKLQNIFHGS